MTLKQGWMAVAFFAALSVRAQEAASPRAARYERSLALGATLMDGNSETMLANGSLLLTGESEKLGSFKVGLEGNYGENTRRTIVKDANGNDVEIKDDEKTVSNARLSGHVRKTVTPRSYLYLDGFVLNDDIADIDYRATVGPGLGLYLMKSDTMTLSAEGGVAQVWEEVANIEDDYLALRLAESFEYRFAGNAKLWQSLVYLPELSDFDNFLLTAEVGLEAPLQGRLNLRVVLQDKYDSRPGDGIEKNDLVLIAGVNIKL